MKKFLAILCSICAVFILGSFNLAFAEPKACQDMPDGPFKQDVCQDGSNAENEMYDRIKTILNIIYIVIGVVAVCVIVYSGITMTISAGDPGKVTKGKNAIISSMIGLIIAVFAAVITSFIINAVKSNTTPATSFISINTNERIEA